MITATLLAQVFDGRFHHHGHPWLGLLFFVFVGVALGLAVWALLRAGRPAHQFAGPAPVNAPPDPAMETLRIRFARGEIDAAEYAARAAHLGAVPPAPAAPPAPPAPNG